MAWSDSIKGEIIIDGDEGTIYLPPEVFKYMHDHRFSIICMNKTPNLWTSISAYAEGFVVHETKQGD